MYHDDAHEVSIESDEDGFHLLLKCDALDLNIRIEQVYEALYDQARARIEPHLRERAEALRTLPTGHRYRSFGAGFPVDEGYEPSDPKSSQFHSVHADLWDSREGK